ncbi:protein NETWORKED 4A-like [Cucurbita moschata]|uniref:Protein NETWORKED 4A-like n=1 Tax=Cucurbita moschata TaxID=3662 RepID=A0A6J1EC39_CUCMO|nr:protein NETWORKED 4A-like [Cucurbita moschata]XP_022923544.1 protein NETWORKED 4A-like [Cucurbita moschata]XP_022923552.1 protein NETWORKED 4A-like [Cucurbita moschata]
MENSELKKLKPLWPEDDIQNRSKWLSNNLEEMTRNVEQMLKAMKENSDNFPKSADMDSQVEEFSRLYQSLVGNVLSPELQLQVPVYSDCGSPQGTPELSLNQKQDFNMSSNRGLDVSFDSGGGSSSLSLKDGSESSSSSSSSSSSDSELESVDNPYAVSRDQRDGQGQKKKLLELQTELPSKIRGALWGDEEDKVNYDELYERIARLEEELKVSNIKLQSSENEVARLKSEVEKNETAILLSEGLQAQLESAEKDKQQMETDLRVEKRRVLELERQIEQLETRSLESNSKIERLSEEIETCKEIIKSSDDKTTRLTHELETTKSNHHFQIKELETAFQVSQERFHAEKEQMQIDILRQVEADKTEMRALHNAHETALQREISQLKEELFSRSESLAALNRTHDELKLKYDMLMAEKDDISAMVNTLLADKESRKSQVQELEDHLQILQAEKEGLIARSESQNKQIDDLKSKLSELQEEVKIQKTMLEDGAKGKKEAIRQLCFSLEHYRSGYQELREAFIGHKPRPALSALVGCL